MKYKAIFFVITLLSLFINQSFAQQVFQKRYIFSKEKFKTANLFMIVKSNKTEESETGHFTINGTETKIYSTITTKINSYSSKEIFNKLKGRITERNGDTLFIKFWDITSTKRKGTKYVNIDDNDNDFIYVVPTTQWINNRYIKIPYSYRMFTATNLPFKINLNNGKLQTDFLNFNIAHLWVFGRAKLFKKDFIEDRYFHFGVGPYIGLTSIENKTDDTKKEFGLTYGGTMLFSIHNFNIIGAFGLENGFTKNTNSLNSYFGLGLGFKLVDLYDPEVKKKE